MKKIGLLAAVLVLVAVLAQGADFSKVPSNWINGYSCDGTNMVIPIAAMPYLSAGQCDAATGDVRQIVFALQETIYQKWLTIPSSNRSERIQVSRSSTVYTNRITHTYTYQVSVIPASLIVMPE